MLSCYENSASAGFRSPKALAVSRRQGVLNGVCASALNTTE